MRIQFVHASLSAGGGKNDEGLMEFLKEKRSVIVIVIVIVIEDDKLNLCCARAIVVAVASVDYHRTCRKLVQGMKLQLKVASNLNEKGGCDRRCHAGKVNG